MRDRVPKRSARRMVLAKSMPKRTVTENGGIGWIGVGSPPASAQFDMDDHGSSRPNETKKSAVSAMGRKYIIGRNTLGSSMAANCTAVESGVSRVGWKRKTGLGRIGNRRRND